MIKRLQDEILNIFVTFQNTARMYEGPFKKIHNNHEVINESMLVGIEFIIKTSSKVKQLDLYMWMQQGLQQCLYNLTEHQAKLGRTMMFSS